MEQKIEDRIHALEERNRRVEADKAWETSLTRRAVILVLTYLVIGVFFTFANIAKPWLNAIVPTLGFMLSTLSLPIIKKWWLWYTKRNY